MRTSPDTQGLPLIDAIAEHRKLDSSCISLGAGSSEIIHRVLPMLFGKGPAVILDPTYSEYGFVFSRDGIAIHRYRLKPEDDFKIDVTALIEFCQAASIVVLVNPNNPTGQALSRSQILRIRDELPQRTTLWVDEAYVDYCPAGTTVEHDASKIDGLYVLKSLSKAYALSGIRAAYLTCTPKAANEIKRRTPPWIIGTSAQRAGCAALGDTAYYKRRWIETADRLDAFANALRDIGLIVHAGRINAVLIQSPLGSTGTDWAKSLRDHGLIVRTPEGMGEVLADNFIRISLPPPALESTVLAIIFAAPV